MLNERADSEVANVDNSVLAKLIQLKWLNPQLITGKLDSDYDLAFDHETQCPTVAEFARFEHEHPKWGMPYAMPGLSLKEEFTLVKWLQEGGKAEALPALSAKAIAEIEKWENYFNGSGLKQKLVFRYIFEHLFIGHMLFKGLPDNEFFRWVRSKTPVGQPIVEINSVRPYDDPGAEPFYYRLKAVTETIVEKITSSTNSAMKR
ncbi:MAG: fatty acid cis/trans isomerase [Gammaproteobacteria bacterium]